MTKEEAIYLLRNTAWLATSLEPVEEAVDMAIEALERTDTHECDVVSRDKVLNLVLDVCNDVMNECETVTGICGEEVYTDVREIDAILKCNKRIRNGIRRLPSEPVGNSDTLEWIPCSERLPEEEGWYLVTIQNDKTEKRRTENDLFAIGIAEAHKHTPYKFCKDGHRQTVIAWMPIPEPYREDGEA